MELKSSFFITFGKIAVKNEHGYLYSFKIQVISKIGVKLLYAHIKCV